MGYNAIRIEKGSKGWGGPLVIKPEGKRTKVVCVTGGGIVPVAKKIAELSGCTIVDGFKTTVPDDEIFVAVVDCGGTARCGVYPQKKVYTVNLTPVGQSGPLAKFITEDIYVSGVKLENITLAEEDATVRTGHVEEIVFEEEEPEVEEKTNIITRIGKVMGGVMGKFFAAGKETMNMVINNILPFMAFVSMLVGIITASGAGDWIAKTLTPIAGSLPGLVVLALICAIPILSPVLGPGAVIAQVVGVFVGVEIGKGTIPVAYALPALYGINAQVGCDFFPVALSMAEAEPETVEIGVPAILFSRLITGPLAVVIAWVFSIGMF
ncbi:PTS glucitol/sorbitol transporter subunit IIB [Irregularibacter muris]|uniref:PTS glucitol/sorbitol transporter subunit IIB n=2 Tax=Irregularibacter muris TaxID=1796619 RepID=A0AAE3HE62_9FIRM|nr:PTS glucitol/sorbitol transporter subunit IIB [Irregularibacter muris]